MGFFTPSPTLPTTSLQLRVLDLVLTHIGLLAFLIHFAGQGYPVPFGPMYLILSGGSLILSSVYNVSYIKLHSRIPTWAQIFCSLVIALFFAAVSALSFWSTDMIARNAWYYVVNRDASRGVTNLAGPPTTLQVKSFW